MSSPSPSKVAETASDISAEHEARPGLITRRFDAYSANSTKYLATKHHGGETPAVEKTCLHHNKKHFGETPHTVRHQLRGGNVQFLSDEEVKAEVYANAALATKAMKDAAVAKRMQEDAALKWEDMCSTSAYGTDKIGHVEAHYYQTPETAEEFATQLLAESSFPQILRKIGAAGEYAAIEAEVKAYKFTPEVPTIIIWYRNNGKDAGRLADERDSSLWFQGAIEAVAEAKGFVASKVQVLVMGDTGTSHSGKAIHDLRGHHVTTSAKTARTILQQMMFLSAVIEESGACLAVGQRSGLLDLLSLVGGIPICQYVSSENTRLNEVFVSGCGMGGAVVLPNSAKSELTKLMKAACKRQILLRQQLIVEIDHWKETDQLMKEPTIAAKQPCPDQ